MKQLMTLKNGAILRILTNLRTCLNSETRWSSTYSMFFRFHKLKEHLALVTVDKFDTLFSNAVEC